MWKNYLSTFNESSIPISVIGGEIELVRNIQAALGAHGYLDPPADNIYGKVTDWALGAFCYRQGLSLGAGFTKAIAAQLAEPSVPLPAIVTDRDWFGHAVQYALDQGHWFCRHPDCVNILYIEGIDADGQVNENLPNRFNDLRTVFTVNAEGVPEFTVWEGTTEPGTYWTINPMNPKGAARIAFGQYKSWRVGMHHSHEALVQVRDLTVHRDLNQDFRRSDDKTYTGLFGINQHWGYDLPKNDLGRSSAGCLVGRSKSGHVKFMSAIKSDARYAAGNTYTFMSSVIPGDRIAI